MIANARFAAQKWWDPTVLDDPGFVYSATVARLWGVLAMRLAGADILPFDFIPYADTIAASLAPLQKEAGSNVDFAGLTARVSAFRRAAEGSQVASVRLLAGRDSAARQALGERLMAAEGNWLDADGLPGRPWNRHMIYGMRLNFLPLMLPGITEAVNRKDWPGAQDQVRRLEKALDVNTSLLQESN